MDRIKRKFGIIIILGIFCSLAFNFLTLTKTPNIWIQINDCDQMENQFYCDEIPTLILLADSLDEKILAIAVSGTYGEESFECKGNICQIPLERTDALGTEIFFQATYSDGSISPKYWAIIRVLNTELIKTEWQMDIISTQLRNVSFFCCAVEWGAFPPTNPYPIIDNSSEDLFTQFDYNYLANNFIKAGMVDASSCQNEGMQNSEYANFCGYQMSQEKVYEWQNRFNEVILSASRKASIPPMLLKSIIAQESQFWPGDHDEIEFGFGHMTEEGIDSLLLWSPKFMEQTYIEVFGQPEESNLVRFGLISDFEISKMKEYVLSEIKMTCVFCEHGLDMSKVERNIEILAFAIAANAHQAGQVIRNTTGMRPGKIISYEDLWRMTLVNYHAGPQCLGDVIEATYVMGENISYQQLTKNFTQGCITALEYVKKIMTEGG